MDESRKHYYIMGPGIEQVVNGVRQVVKIAIISSEDISEMIKGDFIEVAPVKRAEYPELCL